MQVEIRPEFMGHEGGTKFYEIVQFHNNAGGRHATVFRWGKMGEAGNGGGQVKIERCASSGSAITAAAKKRSEKSGRGYQNLITGYGLFKLGAGKKAAGTTANSFNVANAEMREKLAGHYDLKTVEAIMNALGFDSAMSETAEIRATFGKSVPAFVEPKPEPVRGADWGSW
jgi:predicted DNA-binding WGR domain protein